MAIAELVLRYVDTLVWPVVTLLLVWLLRAQIREAFQRLVRVETPAGALEFEAEARAVREEADDLTSPDGGPGVEGPSRRPGGRHAVGDTDWLGWPPEPDEEPEPDEDREPDLPPNRGERPAPYEHGGGAGWGAASGGGGPEPPPRVAPRPRRWGIFGDAMEMAEVSPVGAVVTAWTTLLTYEVSTLESHGFTPRPDPSGVHDAHEVAWQLAALGASPEMADVHEGLRALRNKAVDQPHSVTPEAARDFVRSCRTLAVGLRRLSGTPDRG
ncbi:hypothetical protein ACFWMQ_25290 [Streptomyces sp. NPDC058372]|uniref:hypothetical protein n=1 Tax=Streptomyces sp. NPDC058372 TaxID=3346464 RepID=UPI0036568779